MRGRGRGRVEGWSEGRGGRGVCVSAPRPGLGARRLVLGGRSSPALNIDPESRNLKPSIFLVTILVKIFPQEL